MLLHKSQFHKNKFCTKLAKFADFVLSLVEATKTLMKYPPGIGPTIPSTEIFLVCSCVGDDKVRTIRRCPRTPCQMTTWRRTPPRNYPASPGNQATQRVSTRGNQATPASPGNQATPGVSTHITMTTGKIMR